MRARSITQSVVFCLIAFAAAIGLTGCFKGDIAVDVNANGSGIVAIAFGMTQQAKALLSSSSKGSDSIQDMQNSFSDGSNDNTQKVKVTKWIDGEYEWVKAEKEFDSLDEINKTINDRKLFNYFSLTRKRGIIQDEFTLNAEMDSLSNRTSSGGGFDINPSAFIQMNFSVRLPGKIVEANGITDINDPNRIIWAMQGNQAVAMKARSVTWNWLNIFLISGFLFFGVVLVGGLVVFFYPTKKANLKKAEPVVKPPVRLTNNIINLDVENLLGQVNTKALNSIGTIFKKQEEIALVWKDASGKQRFIIVKDLENNQISVNDQVYLATIDNVKSGLISALQTQKE